MGVLSHGGSVVIIRGLSLSHLPLLSCLRHLLEPPTLTIYDVEKIATGLSSSTLTAAAYTPSTSPTSQVTRQHQTHTQLIAESKRVFPGT